MFPKIEKASDDSVGTMIGCAKFWKETRRATFLGNRTRRGAGSTAGGSCPSWSLLGLILGVPIADLQQTGWTLRQVTPTQTRRRTDTDTEARIRTHRYPP